MRVHDYVRDEPIVGEGKIDLWRDEAYDSLLPVPRGKFVADFWASGLARLNLDKTMLLLGAGEHDFVNVGWVLVPIDQGGVSIFVTIGIATERDIVGVDWCLFHHVDLTVADLVARMG